MWGRNTQLVSWEDVAAGTEATRVRGVSSDRREALLRRCATEHARTLERVALPWDTATAERAVVPRIGASNDGETEADTEPR
jgi:hypothetical protein